VATAALIDMTCPCSCPRAPLGSSGPSWLLVTGGALFGVVPPVEPRDACLQVVPPPVDARGRRSPRVGVRCDGRIPTSYARRSPRTSPSRSTRRRPRSWSAGTLGAAISPTMLRGTGGSRRPDRRATRSIARRPVARRWVPGRFCAERACPRPAAGRVATQRRDRPSGRPLPWLRIRRSSGTGMSDRRSISMSAGL